MALRSEFLSRHFLKSWTPLTTEWKVACHCKRRRSAAVVLRGGAFHQLPGLRRKWAKKTGGEVASSHRRQMAEQARIAASRLRRHRWMLHPCRRGHGLLSFSRGGRTATPCAGILEWRYVFPTSNDRIVARTRVGFLGIMHALRCQSMGQEQLFPCAALNGVLSSEDEQWALREAKSVATKFISEFRPRLRRLFIQPYLETVRWGVILALLSFATESVTRGAFLPHSGFCGGRFSPNLVGGSQTVCNSQSNVSYGLSSRRASWRVFLQHTDETDELRGACNGPVPPLGHFRRCAM